VKIVYANQTPPDSWTSAIFLAGPTPRADTTIPSWRPDALKYLKDLGYTGVVFIPEDEDGTWLHNYDDQIEWEEMCLKFSDVIIFWIPRDLEHMPAFTTNDEWGYWKAKDPVRLVLGTPPDAPKVRYQRYYAEKQHVPTYNTLEDVCTYAFNKTKSYELVNPTDTQLRSGGERSVPLHVWCTPSFQSWYTHLQSAGNRLDGASVEWIFRVGPTQEVVFFWILHVDVFITAEGRSKTNEVVIARPDISTILLYERRNPVRESRIVLVQEFRNPVSNHSGYVYELAGGSSFKPGQDPLTIAVEECEEEVGIRLKPERFLQHQTRQIGATTLAHSAHLFSAELTTKEMDDIAANAEVVRGVEADTERTWANVHTYGDLLDVTHIDWSMLGMIASVLQE